MTGMAMQSTWTCNCSWLRAHFELIASPTASRGSARPRRASTRRLGAPGDGEHRRRVGRQHLRIFDAGDAPRRNGEHLGDADQVFQNCHALVDAAIEVDALARLRTQARLHMGDAFAMHDPPQSVRIGAGGSVECEQQAQRLTDRDSGSSPRPRRPALAWFGAEPRRPMSSSAASISRTALEVERSRRVLSSCTG